MCARREHEKAYLIPYSQRAAAMMWEWLLILTADALITVPLRGSVVTARDDELMETRSPVYYGQA